MSVNLFLGPVVALVTVLDFKSKVVTCSNPTTGVEFLQTQSEVHVLHSFVTEIEVHHVYLCVICCNFVSDDPLLKTNLLWQ